MTKIKKINRQKIVIPTVVQFATQNERTEGYTDTSICKFKYKRYTCIRRSKIDIHPIYIYSLFR